MKPGLTDVAQRAGVSNSAVSRTRMELGASIQKRVNVVLEPKLIVRESTASSRAMK
jgi:DNA-binding LacI/PurR family transcriptional regulator